MNNEQILSLIEMIDPYNILNIDKNASIHEIKISYKNKIKNAHPDKGGDKEQYKRIQLAYKILSNMKFREKFDKIYTSNFQEIKTNFENFKNEQENNKLLEKNKDFDIYNFNKSFLENKSKEDNICDVNLSISNFKDYDSCHVNKLNENDSTDILNKLMSERNYENDLNTHENENENENEFDINAFQLIFEHFKNEKNKNEIQKYTTNNIFYNDSNTFTDINYAFNDGFQNDENLYKTTYEKFINIDNNFIDQHKNRPSNLKLIFDQQLDTHIKDREQLQLLHNDKFITNVRDIHDDLFSNDS
jgi:curved DNA-binding protein CbpA